MKNKKIGEDSRDSQITKQRGLNTALLAKISGAEENLLRHCL
jgi:hypothetical protein